MYEGIKETSGNHIRQGNIPGLRVSETLYADDTLLVEYQEQSLQSFLESVASVGARYRLELHWAECLVDLLSLAVCLCLVFPKAIA